jgi:hypothetical protein
MKIGKVSFKKEHRQETIIYLALWLLMFMAPVLSLGIRTAYSNDISFDWSEVMMVWREYIPFFMVFLIHNHLLAPILVYRQRKWTYVGMCIVIVCIFQVYQCNHRPNFKDHRRFRHEMMEQRRPLEPRDEPDRPMGDENRPPLPPDETFGEPPMEPFEEMEATDSASIRRYEPGDYRPHRNPRFEDRPDRRRGERARLFMGQHDIIAVVILLLMMGMNIGIKLYFKQRGDRKRLEQLEKENLEQQLEYLKYQINPHFLMNTLNNIHALVDIDPEKSKQTILELSKMMRFVLYEGNKQVVPLDREIAFLQNYIQLMKLRYTDKVKITVDVPKSLPNKEVPPLMFITFVENAFKHGVSYRQASFIDIAISIGEDKLVFDCRNSRIPKEDDKHGGVGLANVKKRLELIYGNRYTLDIKDEQDTYTVKLSLPL